MNGMLLSLITFLPLAGGLLLLCLPKFGERLLFSLPLRPAAWQARNPYRDTLLRPPESHPVFHNSTSDPSIPILAIRPRPTPLDIQHRQNPHFAHKFGGQLPLALGRGTVDTTAVRGRAADRPWREAWGATTLNCSLVRVTEAGGFDGIAAGDARGQFYARTPS